MGSYTSDKVKGIISNSEGKGMRYVYTVYFLRQFELGVVPGLAEARRVDEVTKVKVNGTRPPFVWVSKEARLHSTSEYPKEASETSQCFS